MSVDQMSVNQMSVNQMSVDQISVDQMTMSWLCWSCQSVKMFSMRWHETITNPRKLLKAGS
jgi:hypothetical protein